MDDKNMNINADKFEELDMIELQEIDGGDSVLSSIIIKLYQKVAGIFG